MYGCKAQCETTQCIFTVILIREASGLTTETTRRKKQPCQDISVRNARLCNIETKKGFEAFTHTGIICKVTSPGLTCNEAGWCITYT